MEDFRQSKRWVEDFRQHSDAENLCLDDIQSLLATHGKTVHDFGLPEPRDFDRKAFDNRDLERGGNPPLAPLSPTTLVISALKT